MNRSFRLSELQRVSFKVEYTTGKEVLETVSRRDNEPEIQFFVRVEQVLKGFFGVDDDSF